MIRHIFHLLLALGMVFPLAAGCGSNRISSGDDDDSAADDDDDSAATDDDDAADDDDASDDDDVADDDDDVVDDDDDAVGDDDDATGDTCIDDAYEPNNAPAGATQVTDGTVTGLSSCPDDNDYYRISLGAGDELEVSVLFSHAEGDIDVELIDGAGTMLDSGVSTDDNESLSLGSLSQPMDVFALVSLYADSGAVPGNSYELEINISGAAGDDDDAAGDDDDAAGDDDDSVSPVLFIDGEPNDSQATAYDLGGVAPSADLAFESELGNFSSLDLADWWEFTMVGAAASCFDLDVGFVGSTTASADVEVYRPNGTLITSDSFSAGNNALLSNVTSSVTSNYFFRILPSTVLFGVPYSVDIDVKPAFGCP